MCVASRQTGQTKMTREQDRAGRIVEGKRAERRFAGRPTAPWLPLAFVVFSLLALAVIPTIEGRIVAEYQGRLREVVQPARRLLAEIQLSLALGRSALRDYLATNGAGHLERYRQAVAFAEGAHPVLRALV